MKIKSHVMTPPKIPPDQGVHIKTKNEGWNRNEYD